MAEDNSLKFRVDVDGVPQAKGLLDQLSEAFGKLGKSAQSLVKDAELVGRGIAAMNAGFAQGDLVQGFAGAMQALSGAFQAATNPIGLATEALAAFYLETKHLATESVGLFRSLQQLQAVSGETARHIEVIGHAFELAGVPADTLNMAMFRLGNEIERGGKTLRRFGVEATDEFGQMKTEGQILLQVRDAMSDIGDASTRNAVLMQMFGRAGRSLAPIMAKSREEFAHFIALSEEAAASSRAFMEETGRYVTAQAESNHEWEKLRTQIAETIALPVMTWLKHLESAWVSGFNRMYTAARNAFRAAQGKGSLEEAEASATVADVSKTLTRSGGKGVLSGILGMEKAKEMEQTVKDDRDLQERRLRAQEQFEMLRSKMMTGSDLQALEFKRQTNMKIIALEEQTYNNLMDIERRKGTSGAVDPAVEAKHRKERDTKIQAAQAENQKIDLQEQQSRMQEMKKFMDAEMHLREQASGEIVAEMKDRAKQEVAVLEASGSSKEQVIRRANAVELNAAQSVGQQKIALIDEEIQKWRDYKQANAGIFAAEFEANQKILELGIKRVSAERDMNNQIFDARKQLIDKLRSLAEQEAAAAESLESKALSRLEKRGKRSASESEVSSEIDRMQREAQSTLASYAGGVSIARLREARGVAPSFGKLGEGGIGGGMSALNAIQQAQLMGATPNVGPGGSPLPSLTSMVTSANIKQTLSNEIAEGARDGASRGAAEVLDAFSRAFGQVGQMAGQAAGGAGGGAVAGEVPSGGTGGGAGYDQAGWRQRWNPTGADEPVSELAIEIARQLGREAKRS